MKTFLWRGLALPGLLALSLAPLYFLLFSGLQLANWSALLLFFWAVLAAIASLWIIYGRERKYNVVAPLAMIYLGGSLYALFLVWCVNALLIGAGYLLGWFSIETHLGFLPPLCALIFSWPSLLAAFLVTVSLLLWTGDLTFIMLSIAGFLLLSGRKKPPR